MKITWVKEIIVKFQIDYIILNIFKHRQLTVVLNQQQIFVQHNFMNTLSLPGQMRKYTERNYLQPKYISSILNTLIKVPSFFDDLAISFNWFNCIRGNIAYSKVNCIWGNIFSISLFQIL